MGDRTGMVVVVVEVVEVVELEVVDDVVTVVVGPLVVSGPASVWPANRSPHNMKAPVPRAIPTRAISRMEMRRSDTDV